MQHRLGWAGNFSIQDVTDRSLEFRLLVQVIVEENNVDEFNECAGIRRKV